MLHTKIFITICSILLLYLVLLLEFMDDDPILEKSETIALDSLQAQEFNPEPVSTKWPRNKTRCLAPEHGKSGQIKEKTEWIWLCTLQIQDDSRRSHDLLHAFPMKRLGWWLQSSANMAMAEHGCASELWNVWIQCCLRVNSGMSWSQLPNSIIFQRGRYTTNQVKTIDDSKT